MSILEIVIFVFILLFVYIPCALAFYCIFRDYEEPVFRAVIYAIIFPISVPCAMVFGYDGYYG